MIFFPNAKINIGLNVVSQRPDGFRNLESAFYPVKWCDALEMVPADTLSFHLSGIPVPGDPETNLCGKAFQLLQADYGIPAVSMHLHKNIPIGAGLGGGSADAAFALRLLNELFDLHLSLETLEDYARRLGSDCAFFIRNKPVFATERGDVFQPLALDLRGFTCQLVYPNLHITTAEAYSLVVPRQPVVPLLTLLQQDLAAWKDAVHNDFETALFPRYPELAQIKARLYEAGAGYAAMSGSGSTIYGIFPPGTTTYPDFPAHYRVWQGDL